MGQQGEALDGSVGREFSTMAFTFEICGVEITHPAKFSVAAEYSDGRKDHSWMDDREQCLRTFEALKAKDDATFLIAFDYEAVIDLGFEVKRERSPAAANQAGEILEAGD